MSDPVKVPASGGRPRILVVDDASEVLNILLYALKDDYTVIGTRSGPKALQMAASIPAPDLILLDIVMPGMDGYQVCARLKENEATRSIPVIFLTALEEEESETIGFNLGAVDYIRKPIRVAALHLRVKLHIELLLSHRRLEEQNRYLEKAAQLREDVENITRHDLKGPLTSIIGVPEILLMECDFTEGQRDLVKTIEKAGYRMLEMINRSLDLFKMENGKYDFHPESVDILLVVRQALAELAPIMAAKSLQVIMQIDGQTPKAGCKVMALAEKFLCHSMLSNLFKNAVEASPSDEIINVNFQYGAVVSIYLENGGSVPEEIRHSFFDKFVTAGKRSGTGLGTYSARLIAQTQGGAISLDTTVPGRTCVRITLPRVVGWEP